MSTIPVLLTSSLTSSERKLSPEWSLDYLKQRFEQITGIPPEFQEVRLYSSSGYELLSGDQVSDMGINPGARIHVHDLRPSEDGEPVKEFRLDDEEYAKRTDSVLRWKEANKLGRFDPQYQQQQQKQKAENEKKAQVLKIGQRCCVRSDAGERRGVLRYVGKIPQIPGDSIWAGVELDEPLGKNDGSIKGVRYFSCGMKFGVFAKPVNVEVGDFPPLDVLSDDEI